MVGVFECRVDASGARRQALIADLLEAAEPLHHMELMLAARAYVKTAAVELTTTLLQRPARAPAPIDLIVNPDFVGSAPILLIPVGAITVQFALLAMHQLRELVQICFRHSGG